MKDLERQVAIRLEELTKTFGDVVANDSISVDDTALRFDNIELQRIVAILCEYYGVEARYENEDAKHLRLYVRIDKTKSIDEVVEFLNHFDKVSMEVHDNQLIIK